MAGRCVFQEDTICVEQNVQGNSKTLERSFEVVQRYGVLIGRAYSLPSVTGAGKLGIRFAIIAALPLWRRTPSLDQV